jgi:hypothetical protein
MSMGRKVWLGLLASFTSVIAAPASAQAQQKPNILVIMGDDMATGISAPTTGA